MAREARHWSTSLSARPGNLTPTILLPQSHGRTRIAQIMGVVADKLGFDAKPIEIQAEPYKLRLYEEGAFFLPHQDSGKERWDAWGSCDLSSLKT
ncbi:hypothetical protein BDV12DRAFT_180947 [Aspergillus spectabilis]